MKGAPCRWLKHECVINNANNIVIALFRYEDSHQKTRASVNLLLSVFLSSSSPVLFGGNRSFSVWWWLLPKHEPNFAIVPRLLTYVTLPSLGCPARESRKMLCTVSSSLHKKTRIRISPQWSCEQEKKNYKEEAREEGDRHWIFIWHARSHFPDDQFQPTNQVTYQLTTCVLEKK